MKARRLAALALSGWLALACVLGLFLLNRDSLIDRGHFEALRVGMTRGEAGDVLGGAPRNECRDNLIVWVPNDNGKLRSAHFDRRTPAPRFFSDSDGVTADEAVWVGKSGLIAAR